MTVRATSARILIRPIATVITAVAEEFLVDTFASVRAGEFPIGTRAVQLVGGVLTIGNSVADVSQKQGLV